MTGIIDKALEGPRKKISYDIYVEALQMIDELAEATNCTRAQILDSILFSGMKSQVDFMIGTWKELVKNKKYEGKQEKIKELIKNVENFKKKWKFDELFLEMEKAINKAKR
jgi:hypothetical protein